MMVHRGRGLGRWMSQQKGGGRQLFVLSLLTVGVVFSKPQLYPNLNKALTITTIVTKSLNEVVILTRTKMFYDPKPTPTTPQPPQ